MVHNFTRCIIEEDGRSREIEFCFAGPAMNAKTFDRNCRRSTLPTMRWGDRNQGFPTGGTHSAIAAFQHLRAADDARNRENEIQYGIDHCAGEAREART